jgi:NADH-quinone oxidoreductase subunit M
MQSITDLQAYEMIGAGALVGCILLFGLLPALWIELSTATIDRMLLVIGERLP